MHSAGLELTKLTYARLEDNLIRHRGDRTVYNENFCFSDQHRKLRGEFYFSLDGGEGEPMGIECEREQREQVRRSRPSELRRFGGHRKPQQEDGTRRPTTGTHIIMRAAIVFFIFRVTLPRQQYNMLLTSLIFVEFVEELYTLHGKRPAAIFNLQARAS